MLELNLVNGEGLDIPAETIVMFEAMTKDTNPNFPSARCFIRYAFSPDQVKTAILTETFDEMVRRLEMNVRPGPWLVVTRDDGNKMAVQFGNILGRMAIKDENRPKARCELQINTGAGIAAYFVQETREVVKDRTETLKQALQNPEGFAPPPPPIKAKKGRGRG